ncbi:conserved hypothetical protein [Thermosulfidibacter takaii ABI70S6]|uniref:Gcp-like domain-containing protein n=1 Tax=Thermosulfidibacter takaii (strain DSM 17441 / JCM 13301 / NBRC 103674 / ABI70S6) TaxID=1298851 RepID=A0A0S3QUR4_THET7|nr:tRNA (adenosine(37)-N6)-threonylcarbamoyltransferase complex dimerization subunit type 1 TsaB [Thermosulfidibacter takaii]BAT72063.1 conserved hypothetical protein [Thermosulfidibacter takaii ABI70S6]
MLILALDTTTEFISVAVFEDEKVLSEFTVKGKKSTSSKLFVLIDEVLTSAEVDKTQLDVVACAVGPGSFTGVRIGVAAVKGFVFASQKKVVAVSTLEAMASLCPVQGRLLFPILDARRGQFYGAMFRWMNSALERLSEDLLLNPEDVERIAGSVLFVGEAAGRLGYDYFPVEGLAKGVARVAFKKAQRNEFTDLFKLKPVYLRLSDAEQSKGIVVYKG